MTRTQRRGMLLIAFVMFAWWAGSLASGNASIATVLFAQQPPVVEVPGSVPTPQTTDRPSQEAVPTKEVPSPAAPSNMPESVGWALGATYIYEYLKKSGWFTPIAEKSSSRAKAVFGFVMAFLTAAGIQFAVSGSVFDAGGASVTFTGITLTGIKDVLFQWIAQQGWYDALVHKRDAPAVVNNAV